jgi:hypothetical protein
MTTTLASKIDRRRFPRFVLPVAYTPVAVRLMHDRTFDFEGHAYDLSEGGIRFELDRPVPPGTRVAMRLDLPDWADGRTAGTGIARAVFAFCTVVWIEDEDEPGPVKMAAVFNEFCRAGDRDRLLATFATGRYRLAA